MRALTLVFVLFYFKVETFTFDQPLLVYGLGSIDGPFVVHAPLGKIDKPFAMRAALSPLLYL
jgi:hypothetical protein